MTPDQTKIFADELIAEYKPQTHAQWQELLRRLSAMSNKATKPLTQSELRSGYAELKNRYRIWMNKQSISLPKGVLGND